MEAVDHRCHRVSRYDVAKMSQYDFAKWEHPVLVAALGGLTEYSVLAARVELALALLMRVAMSWARVHLPTGQVVVRVVRPRVDDTPSTRTARSSSGCSSCRSHMIVHKRRRQRQP